MRIYVPSDSTALSLGADDIARALAELKLDIDIVRNGSRGLCWLEPLLEIDSPGGRLGIARVSADKTRIQVLKEPGKTPQSNKYMWVTRGGPPDKPSVLFD